MAHPTTKTLWLRALRLPNSHGSQPPPRSIHIQKPWSRISGHNSTAAVLIAEQVQTMSQRKFLPLIAAVIAAWTMLCPAARAATAHQPPGRYGVPDIANHDAPFWWAQIDYTKPQNVPWDDADFAKLAQSGMNGVEINLDWANLEPKENQYDFQLLDRYMAEAARAHLKLYLLFWESIWQQKQGQNPPPWMTARDLSSDGIAAEEPPWWDQASRRAYFDYVAHTIDHVKTSPGFGGVYASYGWLDSEWGVAPKGSNGVTGYAPQDIRAFYRWLPSSYKTIAAFNHRWQTSFHRWSDIPVSRPGDRLFPVYQDFRQYSVAEGFDAISRLVRAHTSATLLYSWGGDICGRIGPEVQGNDPDIFFQTAKKYHAIVNLDDANLPGLSLLFGSLARSYRVPLLEEWTPGHDRESRTPQWLGHIGLAAPYEVGDDFFIYPPQHGDAGFAYGWAAYQQWHATLIKVIHGRTPEQPVAVIVPTRKILLSADLNAYPDLTTQLTDFWRHYHVLPHFITDEQIIQRTVDLQQFRAVVDLGDEVASLPALKAYSAKHPVLESLDQSVPFLHPYVTVDPVADALEIVPTVEGTSVWLTIANTDAKNSFSGAIDFDPAAVGLGSASFSVENAQTGQIVPAIRSSNGKIRWHIQLAPANLLVLHLDLSHPKPQ